MKNIVAKGQKLVSERHYASERISLQIAEVERGWEELRGFVFIMFFVTVSKNVFKRFLNERCVRSWLMNEIMRGGYYLC